MVLQRNVTQGNKQWEERSMELPGRVAEGVLLDQAWMWTASCWTWAA